MVQFQLGPPTMLIIRNIIFATFLINAAQSFNLNIIIRDYVAEKYLRICIVLSCEKQNSAPILKTLQQDGIWTNVYTIGDGIDFESLDKLLLYRNYYVGIVMDLNCPKSLDILRFASQNILFHNHYMWLLFGSNVNTSRDMLSRQNINIDSDVNVAVVQSNE